MENRLAASVQEVARYWHNDPYYDRAEQDDWLHGFWDINNEKYPFRRLFGALNLEITVELATGHGRHAAQIADTCPALILMDVVSENVAYCKGRFAGRENIVSVQNNGADFYPLPDASVTSVFSYDAMVHFEYDVVLSYVRDAARILKKGGRGLFHHSNYSEDPGGDHRTHPGGRNFMSQALFLHAARRSGLRIIESAIMDWDAPQTDCLTLFEKP